MDAKISVLLGIAILCLVLAFIGRYTLIAVPAGGQGSSGYAYRLDRWTGDVTFIAGNASRPVESMK